MKQESLLPINRRQFLRSSLAVITVPAAARISMASAAHQQPPSPVGALTHYQEAEQDGKERGSKIWLRLNNELLTAYRAQPLQKCPYFYPITGPVSGLPLTSETALPFPHHRSVWLACDRVNGMNYWQQGLERGQIISSGPRVTASSKTSATIEDACRWTPPGKPAVMSDHRRFTITVDGPRLWTLDADIVWKAETAVTVEKTNHSLFAVRAAPDITPSGGGHLISSEGRSKQADTLGKPARWCAFYGKRLHGKNEPVEGIALFEHPKNPWPDCGWFTRDYGFMSPTPFNWITKPWGLARGESVRLRYSVVAFAGDPQEAQLDKLHRTWAAATAE